MLASLNASVTENRRPRMSFALTYGLTIVVILGVFIYCEGFGLRTTLGADDIMNITFAWQPSLHKLALALLVPFTPFYRPVGAAVYRLMFELFGLNFVAFRILTYALLLVNIFLVYCLAFRLSKSKEISAMSALLYTYHGRLSGIYLNNGTLYDVLCATLSLLTLIYYIKIRQQGRFLQRWEWPAFLYLFVCALNAKEMAAAIPLLLFIYELIFDPPRFRGSPGALRWVSQHLAPAFACGILTVLAALAKMGKDSLMHGNQPYAMTVTLPWFLQHWRHLMNHLIYAKGSGLSVRSVLFIWAGVLAAAALTRKPYVWFFLCFALLGPLPVIFIPYRGFFVMYLPLAGWAMLAATLMALSRGWIVKKVFKVAHGSWNADFLSQCILFAAVVLFTCWIARHDKGTELTYVDPSKAMITDMKLALGRLREPVPIDGRILFLHDPFPPDSWGPLMMARLLYRDRELAVDRPTMMKTQPNQLDYDRVFDYTGNKFVVVRSRPDDKGSSRNLLVPR